MLSWVTYWVTSWLSSGTRIWVPSSTCSTKRAREQMRFQWALQEESLTRRQVAGTRAQAAGQGRVEGQASSSMCDREPSHLPRLRHSPQESPKETSVPPSPTLRESLPPASCEAPVKAEAGASGLPELDKPQAQTHLTSLAISRVRCPQPCR